MTAKLITLAGLLLMLSSPAFAAPAQEQSVQSQTSAEQAQPVQAPPQPPSLAWQRVGAPISLET